MCAVCLCGNVWSVEVTMVRLPFSGMEGMLVGGVA